MKCKKCGTEFPRWVWIDGKRRSLQNRKFCLTCSPYKKHNTKDLTKPPRKGIRMTCESCGRVFVYVSSKGHRVGKCNSCCQRERAKNFKKRAVELLGGKCVICGYSKSMAAFVFHHVDPSTKLFGVGSTYNVSWKRFEAEARKCVLLCANCHRELHAGDTTLGD